MRVVPHDTPRAAEHSGNTPCLLHWRWSRQTQPWWRDPCKLASSSLKIALPFPPFHKKKKKVSERGISLYVYGSFRTGYQIVLDKYTHGRDSILTQDSTLKSMWKGCGMIPNFLGWGIPVCTIYLKRGVLWGGISFLCVKWSEGETMSR